MTSTPAAPIDFGAAVRTHAQIMDEMRDVVVMPGRTRGELQDAFNLVKNKTDWKASIEAKLPADTDDAKLTLIEDAVIFFTGGCIEIERDDDGVTVFSEGYYHHIGS
jgi:hypothetical protein